MTTLSDSAMTADDYRDVGVRSWIRWLRENHRLDTRDQRVVYDDLAECLDNLQNRALAAEACATTLAEAMRGIEKQARPFGEDGKEAGGWGIRLDMCHRIARTALATLSPKAEEK